MHPIQLQIALALVLIEAGVFAYLSETWTLPILAAVCSLLAWATPWRFPLNESRRFVAALALAVPCTLQWAFAPYEPEHLRVFILYPLAHAGGQYGLALQTGYMWVKQPGESWSAAFPLCGVCVLMAAADVQTTARQSAIFQVVVLAFVLLTAAYYSRARIPWGPVEKQRSRGRLILSLLTMSATFLIAIGGSLWLERSWTTIERLYTEWMMYGSADGGAGFSRHARLGSIADRSGAQDQIPVLRIHAMEEPGYLRGAAFDRYFNGTWQTDPPRETLPPPTVHPADLPVPPGQTAYPLPGNRRAGDSSADSLPWRSLEVWPVPSLNDAAFFPLEAEWLSLPQSQLVTDAHGIVYPDGLQNDSNYRSYARQSPDNVGGASPSDAAAPLQLSDKLSLASLTSLPLNLDPRIRELANGIFADCPTPDLKVLAATRWFKKNYHYELGLKVPAGQDPLTYFLIRRPAAHCEYFATGTVVLLRLGGVPCRYVTGFVATEYNYFGGYWLARNKDAHAWVEAWLPGRGWVTVESTPTAGIPQSSHSIQPSHLWDDLLLRVQMLRAQLTAGTWSGLLAAARTILSLFFTTPHGWLMLAGLLAWAVVLWRRHVRFTFRRKYDPISAEFHQLLGDLDRRLERLNFRRPRQETLSQFAFRLEQHPDPAVQSAAIWYRDYCAVRYQNDSIPVEIRRLQAALPELLGRLKKLPRPAGKELKKTTNNNDLRN